jgi:hypothetical protein
MEAEVLKGTPMTVMPEAREEMRAAANRYRRKHRAWDIRRPP